MVTIKTTVLGSGVAGREWLQGEARRVGAEPTVGLWPDFIARLWGPTWQCILQTARSSDLRHLCAPSTRSGLSCHAQEALVSCYAGLVMGR